MPPVSRKRCGVAPAWSWRKQWEGKVRPIPGNPPNDRLLRGPDFPSSQESLRRCLSHCLSHGVSKRARGPVAFLRHERFYRSDVIWAVRQGLPLRGYALSSLVGSSIAQWFPYAASSGARFSARSRSSSAMSSGRLFLDRVARQQSPSPLHRQGEHNMTSSAVRLKGDILTLHRRGHFYFALTACPACIDPGTTL
jgi:hypothetical protein